MTWRNRIIGHGTESPDQLLGNPRNFRVHPKAQQDALAGSLNDVGYIQTVIVNKRTGKDWPAGETPWPKAPKGAFASP